MENDFFWEKLKSSENVCFFQVFANFCLLRNDSRNFSDMVISIVSIFENRFFIICTFSFKHHWVYLRRLWLAAHYVIVVFLMLPMVFLVPEENIAQHIFEVWEFSRSQLSTLIFFSNFHVYLAIFIMLQCLFLLKILLITLSYQSYLLFFVVLKLAYLLDILPQTAWSNWSKNGCPRKHFNFRKSFL